MKKLLAVLAILIIPATVIAADAPASDPSLAAAGLSAKVNNLEEENRRLNGKVEVLQHQLEQMQADAAAKPVTISSPTQPVVMGQTTPTPAAISSTTTTTTTSAADGSSVVKTNAYVTKVTPPSAASAEKTTLMNDEFDEIFKNVVAEDYKTAKPQLKAFVEKYPGTSLAGEAYFWLGEIAWSERDFNTAALNYLKGYKEAPTGDKASENILKMALTLKELNKNDEACKWVDRFNIEFPNAHSDLKAKADNAKTELGCK